MVGQIMKLRFETLMHTPYRFTDKLTIYLANWIKKTNNKHKGT